MNIDDALSHAAKQPNQGEALLVVGSIEKDAGSGKVRVYPDHFDKSRYVLIDPQSIAGDVLDITEHVRRSHPSQRNLVFSVPVRKGAEIQIVSMATISVTDVARMSMLSLDQSAGCECTCNGEGPTPRCLTGRCVSVGGGEYKCSEILEDGHRYCSGCCLIA
jgi:hypothetical protein